MLHYQPQHWQHTVRAKCCNISSDNPRSADILLMSRTVIAGSMSADWGLGDRGGILDVPNGDRSGVNSTGNQTTIRSVVHLFSGLRNYLLNVVQTSVKQGTDTALIYHCFLLTN